VLKHRFFTAFGTTAAAVVVLVCVVLATAIADDIDQPIRDALDRGDTATAINLIQKDIESDPGYYFNYFVLGTVYFEREDWQKARVQFEKALDEKSKHWESLYYLGLTYIELGMLDEAEEAMSTGRKKSKEIKDKFEDGYGLVKLAQKDYQEADKAFRQALVIDPDNPDYHIHLGDANYYQGIPSLAILEYEKALEADTASTEVFFHWAEACLEMRDYGCAIEKLQIVLAKDSTHARAWNRAAGIYFRAALSSRTRDDRTSRFKDAIGSDSRDSVRTEGCLFLLWQGLVGRAAVCRRRRCAGKARRLGRRSGCRLLDAGS
jgi:tetratricopeptide (TPR) repeat protein